VGSVGIVAHYFWLHILHLLLHTRIAMHHAVCRPGTGKIDRRGGVPILQHLCISASLHLCIHFKPASNRPQKPTSARLFRLFLLFTMLSLPVRAPPPFKTQFTRLEPTPPLLSDACTLSRANSCSIPLPFHYHDCAPTCAPSCCPAADARCRGQFCVWASTLTKSSKTATAA
jgi:hypothetical protein